MLLHNFRHSNKKKLTVSIENHEKLVTSIVLFICRAQSRECGRRYGSNGSSGGVEPSPSRPPSMRLVSQISSFDDVTGSNHWKCNIKNLRMMCDFKVGQICASFCFTPHKYSHMQRGSNLDMSVNCTGVESGTLLTILGEKT